ncbi:hypothetical protein [Mycobacterium kyorinense]|uniref:hypothetical protein n=1 Tax=Mycobacterium kyorinense TaxID=487514 RepID=UPI000B1F8A26|nr:hypothetical protein [Mycobacterium kyorinense]
MQAADAAASPSLDQPTTLVFFIATLVSLAVAVLPQLFLQRDRSWERRVYWGGTTSAAICAFLASLPDWKLGLGVALFGIVWMLVTAYAFTPYIKVHDKVYAFHVSDSLPNSSSDGSPSLHHDPDYDPAPDSYGGIATAKKTWWLLIFALLVCILSVVVKSEDKPSLMAPIAASAFVIIAAGYGYGDGSWGYPVARGQRVQFYIISIVSIGTFSVLYLSAYWAGRRWPLRRNQSMEYRAHPRHQKRYP